jgi:hypothetical protein
VGAILAALGGAWFVLGQLVTAVAVPSGSITGGIPIVGAGAAFGAATMRLLEGLGFFYGLGVVVVFLAALAFGEVLASRGYQMTEAIGPEDQYGPAY